MKGNGGATDTSFGPQLGERAVWDMDSPDHECDCPGPPPQFYLPPPPRPPSLIDSDCSENQISDLETCEAVPVIDAEYHSSPALPSLAIILIIAVTVVVFLCIGTVLVILRKRKTHNFLPRKSSPQNHCDSATANGVIYEDLTNIRPRALPSNCPPRTALPSIEMMDVNAYPDRGPFSTVFVCPSSPLPESCASQDLFNPVYEELSNGSGERGETDSEGLPQAPVSEDEFAEDELSLAGDLVAGRQKADGRSGSGSLRGSAGNDLCRDADSSDADDKSGFLEGTGRNFGPLSGCKGKRTGRGSHFRGASGTGASAVIPCDGRPRSLDRRRGWRTKGAATPPPDCGGFHEGLLLKTLLQFYPNVAGVGCVPEVADDRYETIPALGLAKPEIFTTFRAAGQGSGKNPSQDSSFGSDSGYSNNTSGGRTSSRGRKDYRLSNRDDLVLS